MTPVLIGLVLLSGCGGGDRAPDGPERSRLTISVTEPSRGQFRYFAPKSVSGGLVEIVFDNAGETPRKAQLWRVGAGHTVEEARKAARKRPWPKWLVTAGGVGATSSDRTGRTIQRLPPGRYYVGGHLGERGSVAGFQVTAGERPKRPRRVRARVTTREYGFRVSGLRPGKQRIEFRNVGTEPHQAYFAPMRRGATLADVRAALSGTRIEPPPISLRRSRQTAVIEGGDEQVTELDLGTGRYALLCFVRDRVGGPPHLEKGMATEVTVRRGEPGS